MSTCRPNVQSDAAVDATASRLRIEALKLLLCVIGRKT